MERGSCNHLLLAEALVASVVHGRHVDCDIRAILPAAELWVHKHVVDLAQHLQDHGPLPAKEPSVQLNHVVVGLRVVPVEILPAGHRELPQSPLVWLQVVRLRSDEQLVRIPIYEKARVVNRHHIPNVCQEDRFPLGMLLHLLFEDKESQIVEAHEFVDVRDIHLQERHRTVTGGVIADELLRQVVIQNQSARPAARQRKHRPVVALEVREVGHPLALALGVCACSEDVREVHRVARLAVILDQHLQVQVDPSARGPPELFGAMVFVLASDVRVRLVARRREDLAGDGLDSMHLQHRDLVDGSRRGRTRCPEVLAMADGCTQERPR
mmetsp:Transcript_114040/g.329423  ORF Transcript_114040/g.329423 Transcript_114040/m.329423 type:complete len:326 (-) Transcript_114040:115-1092(-)